MKTAKLSNLPNVTQDVDWEKYPHAAKWVKKIETEEKKRLAVEHEEKNFTDLEKKLKSPKKLQALYESLEARTRGRVNYYLHKNKELGRMCFLKLFGNSMDLLKALERFYTVTANEPAFA